MDVESKVATRRKKCVCPCECMSSHLHIFTRTDLWHNHNRCWFHTYLAYSDIDIDRPLWKKIHTGEVKIPMSISSWSHHISLGSDCSHQYSCSPPTDWRWSDLQKRTTFYEHIFIEATWYNISIWFCKMDVVISQKHVICAHIVSRKNCYCIKMREANGGVCMEKQYNRITHKRDEHMEQKKNKSKKSYRKLSQCQFCFDKISLLFIYLNICEIRNEWEQIPDNSLIHSSSATTSEPSVKMLRGANRFVAKCAQNRFNSAFPEKSVILSQPSWLFGEPNHLKDS